MISSRDPAESKSDINEFFDVVPGPGMEDTGGRDSDPGVWVSGLGPCVFAGRARERQTTAPGRGGGRAQGATVTER